MTRIRQGRGEGEEVNTTRAERIGVILRYAEEATAKAKNAETMGKFLYHKGRALGALGGLLIIAEDPALNMMVSAQITTVKALEYEGSLIEDIPVDDDRRWDEYDYLSEGH